MNKNNSGEDSFEIQITPETFQMISGESDKYDQRVKDLIQRVEELESQIKLLKKKGIMIELFFERLWIQLHMSIHL